MVIMIDEIFDRQYRTGRQEMNAALLGGITRLGRSMLNAFRVLNRIEYSAPWAVKPRRAGSH
jgi:hypothetical protein